MKASSRPRRPSPIRGSLFVDSGKKQREAVVLMQDESGDALSGGEESSSPSPTRRVKKLAPLEGGHGLPKHIFDDSTKRDFYERRQKKAKAKRRHAWEQQQQHQQPDKDLLSESEGEASLLSEDEEDALSTSSNTFGSFSSPMGSPSKFKVTSHLSSPTAITASPSYSNSPASATTTSPYYSPSKAHGFVGGGGGGGGGDFGSHGRRKLQSLQRNLEMQHESNARLENLVRLQIMQSADAIISALPLNYLYSKPDIRHYAIERAMKPLIRLAKATALVNLAKAFAIWRKPPEVKMNEKQVNFMIIAHGFAKALKRIYVRTFHHWALLYSSKYNNKGAIIADACATQIQRWYRHVRITSSLTFIRITEAIQICLHRRKAIKHALMLERFRREAIFKMRRAVMKRRRNHYGARAMERIWRWYRLYRKTQWRLTRMSFARRVQRWWRMTQYRPEKELNLIKFIISIGGYSLVLSKLNKTIHERFGFLMGVDAMASAIQRAWYKSRGQFAMFLLFAARRAKMEHDKMLNDNATIIQQNFRGHLWNLLLKAAMQFNRARRISKGFRAFVYRRWVWLLLKKSLHKYARKIQHAARLYNWRYLLITRFKLRKAVLVFTRAKKTISAMMIQREYRNHVERERIKLEILKAFIAQQRARADLVMKNITFIQRVWRKNLKTNAFSRHVYLVMWRIVREKRRKEWMSAMRIQKRARKFIKKQIKRRAKKEKKNVNKIWKLAKAFLLKLAIFDRVEARRNRELLASNLMKKNFRSFLFSRFIRFRCVMRRVVADEKKLRKDAAMYIQRWVRRKNAEYILPVRVAGRRQLKKRREAELARRILQERTKAVKFIVRFFRLFPPWNKNLKRIAKERLRILRHRSAKKMQKFARRVIAWGRFERVVAYRRKMELLAQGTALWTNAVNVIGYFYKRRGEIYTLKVRFRNRRLMLDECNRLEEARIIAMQERAEAIEDKRRTDENMRATINASWKQGSDAAGRNYYYNYVTGQTSWVAPENWKTPAAVDKWVRQLDDRQNVYYYNMHTGESSWLPPCAQCGKNSERHCLECSMAFCEKCYDLKHAGPLAEEEEYDKHQWSLVEYAKEKLGPGEIYCLECKKRPAKRMCLTCWDAYCDECFSYTHSVGNLRYHKTMAYKKVKSGWMVIKGKGTGDPLDEEGDGKDSDYYVHGQTGVTTYEKPYELMTTDEKKYYNNFLAHKEAAENHVKKIEELQFKLEEASYERDSILQDALSQGLVTGAVGNVLAKRAKKKKEMEALVEAANTDIIGAALAANKPGPLSWLLGNTVEWRDKILKPDERRRGHARSDYIKSLIDEVENDKKAQKKKGGR